MIFARSDQCPLCEVERTLPLPSLTQAADEDVAVDGVAVTKDVSRRLCVPETLSELMT
jgi:hypothetical protein